MGSATTSAEDEIRARIAQRGKITFAEFMELSLYHPQGGYYARRASYPEHRDYYTSPAAHPAFGALVCIQLWKMWEVLKRPAPFYMVEMGAGDGLLACDVVEFARSVSKPFAEALRYLALDRSPAHITPDDRPAPYQRIVTMGTPLKGVVGCLLSNELVDSFPVHRFQIQLGEIKEVYVSVRDGEFVELLHEPSTPHLARRIRSLSRPPGEGYRGEVNLQVGPWMNQAADTLDRGFVVTIDYGYEAGELYSPRRDGGTLQTFYRHTSGASPYQRVGLQDITAHVDYSAVVSEGEAAGLRPVGLCTQAQYLCGLGLDGWLGRLRTEGLPQRQRDANAMAMRELVRPDGMGGFRVLVQEKGTGIRDLAQLAPLKGRQSGPDALTASLPVPLLRSDHVPLMEGRYPHAGWQWEGLWSQGEEPPGPPP